MTTTQKIIDDYTGEEIKDVVANVVTIATTRFGETVISHLSQNSFSELMEANQEFETVFIRDEE